jgi:hypothetical protein
MIELKEALRNEGRSCMLRRVQTTERVYPLWGLGCRKICRTVPTADPSEYRSLSRLGGIRGRESADDARASALRVGIRRVLRKPHRRVWSKPLEGRT